MRKGPHAHTSSGPAIVNAPGCRQRCHCGLTVAQWADVAPQADASADHPFSILQVGAALPLLAKVRNSTHSGRGPPHPSFA